MLRQEAERLQVQLVDGLQPMGASEGARGTGPQELMPTGGPTELHSSELDYLASPVAPFSGKLV